MDPSPSPHDQPRDPREQPYNGGERPAPPSVPAPQQSSMPGGFRAAETIHLLNAEQLDLAIRTAVSAGTSGHECTRWVAQSLGVLEKHPTQPVPHEGFEALMMRLWSLGISSSRSRPGDLYQRNDLARALGFALDWGRPIIVAIKHRETQQGKPVATSGYLIVARIHPIGHDRYWNPSIFLRVPFHDGLVEARLADFSTYINTNKGFSLEALQPSGLVVSEGEASPRGVLGTLYRAWQWCRGWTKALRRSR